MKKNFPSDLLSIFPEDLKRNINPLALKTIAAAFLFTDKLTFDNILNLIPLDEEYKKILSNLKQKQPDNLTSIYGSVYFGGGTCLAEREDEKIGAIISRDSGDGEGGRKSRKETFPEAEIVSTRENAFLHES